MHKLMNLWKNVNNEKKWLQSQYLKTEVVAEIPENILPEFLLHYDLALLSGKNGPSKNG